MSTLTKCCLKSALLALAPWTKIGLILFVPITPKVAHARGLSYCGLLNLSLYSLNTLNSCKTPVILPLLTDFLFAIGTVYIVFNNLTNLFCIEGNLVLSNNSFIP
jgi:hypothetical protein